MNTLIPEALWEGRIITLLCNISDVLGDFSKQRISFLLVMPHSNTLQMSQYPYLDSIFESTDKQQGEINC